MEYTIEKLLAEEQWKQLNVIEGKESCKRKIEGIRIIEVPEMARYLTRKPAASYREIPARRCSRTEG